MAGLLTHGNCDQYMGDVLIYQLSQQRANRANKCHGGFGHVALALGTLLLPPESEGLGHTISDTSPSSRVLGFAINDTNSFWNQAWESSRLGSGYHFTA